MTTARPLPILTDRSRVTKGWRCKRARFHSTVAGGRGIEPVERAAYFGLGTVFHEAASSLCILYRDLPPSVELVEAIARAAGDRAWEAVKTSSHGVIEFGAEDEAEEMRRWMTGAIYVLGRWILPKLLKDYRIVHVEQEILLPVPAPRYATEVGVRRLDVVLMATPDVVLENIATGELWYLEWKTAGSIDAKWIRQWQKNVQLMGTLRLAQPPVCERGLAGALVMGIYKGYRREGRNNHPFIWTHVRRSVTGENEYSPKWARGLERQETSCYETGVIGYIEEVLGEEEACGHFTLPPPIYVNERLADAYLRQLWWDEQRIEHFLERQGEHGELELEMLMDTSFPQDFSQCEPVFGAPCEFMRACWLAEDPLTSGNFQPRVPHHAAELERGNED